MISAKDKVEKILRENPEIWKTESAYFSYLRGCIRLAWVKNPVKLKLLNKRKKQIPNPNYGKPRNTKKTVMGATCEICLKDYPMKFIQVDHITGGNYSLRSVGDIQGFFESICIVTEGELRLVCLDCHGCLTYAAKEGVSFEQAKVIKHVISLDKENKVVDKLNSIHINCIPSTKIKRKALLLEILLKDLENKDV